MSWMADHVEKRMSMLEAAAATARRLAESGGSVGFCNDPETAQAVRGITQIRTVAVVEGRQRKTLFPFGEKAMRGSAVIFERTFADGNHDIRIVPNDSGVSNIETFTVDDARTFFDSDYYQQVENAIQTNLAHRKARIKVKR